jgi:hypothetical protein
VVSIKLLCRPSDDRPILLRDGGWPLACHLFEHRDLTVAIDTLHRYVQVRQTREGFEWHRTRKYIAPDHYTVNFCLANFLEHGLQSGEVSVNVVDCSDSHGRHASALSDAILAVLAVKIIKNSLVS